MDISVELIDRNWN